MATFNGGSGRDVINGTGDPDDIFGLGGGDDLFGLGGDDLISGAGDDDLIDGGSGADGMEGGVGSDIYVVDNQYDIVRELSEQGDDEVRTALAAYRLDAHVETLIGTSDVDQTLTGNGLANWIDGGRGADTMAGEGGNDVYFVDNEGDVVSEGSDTSSGRDEVRTGLHTYSIAASSGIEKLTGLLATGQELSGNDLANVIAGGEGADTLRGEGERDRLIGGGGDDVLYGGADRDLLDGTTGNDRMIGGDDWDTYIVDSQADEIVEEAGQGTRDIVRTRIKNYVLPDHVEILFGMSANGQRLIGNAQANQINGGSGDDVIRGNGGSDLFRGGRGNDVYFLEAGDFFIESAFEGIDEIRTALARYSIAGDGRREQIENLTGLSEAGQTLTGNDANNVITGAGGDDIIDGGKGNNTLYGGGGDDQLHRGTVFDGGAGADRMNGNLRDNVYFVDNADDLVIEAGSGGVDEVRTSTAAYILGDNVENLTGIAAGSQSLTGTGFSNIIRAGDADDSLAGLLGDDVLHGGEGDDDLDGGDGADTASYAGAAAGVTVGLRLAEAQDTGAGRDTLHAIENLLGSDHGDILRGDDQNNILNGRAGADLLRGDGGNDILIGGLGFDRVTYVAAGAGVNVSLNRQTEQDTGSAGADTLLEIESLTGSDFGDRLGGSNGINRIDGRQGSDLVFGLGGNDLLLGAAGEDKVIGGDGADRLLGGDGADSLAGSNGNDSALGGAGDDRIAGGAGRDLLSGGGGADMFLFDDGDSAFSNIHSDIVGDFSRAQADKINLRQTDADSSTAGDDNFSFIGHAAFSGNAGELRYVIRDGVALVQGDVDGDKVRDFLIRVDGADNLIATDFIL